MKERPPCCIPGCKKPSLIYMLDKFFCGNCIAEWDKRNKEKLFENMKEVMK